MIASISVSHAQIRVIPGLPVTPKEVPPKEVPPAVAPVPEVAPGPVAVRPIYPPHVALTFTGFVTSLQFLPVPEDDGDAEEDDVEADEDLTDKVDTMISVRLKVGGEFPDLWLGRAEDFHRLNIYIGIGDWMKVVGAPIIVNHRYTIVARVIYWKGRKIVIRDENGRLLDAPLAPTPPAALVEPAPVEPAPPAGDVDGSVRRSLQGAKRAWFS